MALLLVLGCGDPRAVDGGPYCATAADCVRVHPAGIADPKSPDFHGELVKARGWNLNECKRCHGDDFAGGKAGKSCLRCHDQEGGPTACTTCHGQPPESGAHQTHAGAMAQGYACSECHPMPTSWDEVGHIFDDQGKVLPKVPMRFGAIATTGGAQPSWDGARCSNVYCHGPAQPAWQGGAAEATCGSCHMIPPASHAQDRCGECHGRVANSQKMIVGRALHADGKVSLGDDMGTCQSCHPKPGGSHTAHVTAMHRITRPLGCDDCHKVPTMLSDPGHIDQPRAVVFPAGTSALARANGSMPTWDVASGQCSNVWCHGATMPSWGGPPVVCGSCHGVPPASTPHLPTMQLQDCVGCHAGAIDASGLLLAKHLDGVIDAQ